jgi:hypothetical protein
MATIDGLRSRVKLMRNQITQEAESRTWCFTREQGEDYPPGVREQIRPQDTVYIRSYPKGLLGGERQGGNWCWGYVYWHGGSAIIRADGRLERVRGQSGRKAR